MELVKVAIFGIATVLLAVELKGHKPVLSLILGMSGAILIMMFSLDKILKVMEQIQTVFHLLGQGTSYFMILIKVLGVTYLCQFSSGICRDAGFGNLAEQIQVFGKLYIMLSGMPILLAFIEMIQNL
ncbi:MAG: stage III sporulation protein AD [Lachnospiraceae bacterium]|nr:stage III sporulation protein AD [Lachnospiraceae bacterium]